MFLDTSGLRIRPGGDRFACQNGAGVDPAQLGLLPSGNTAQSPQNRPDRRRQWETEVQPVLQLAPDALAMGERALVFPKAKDRPVVITALAAVLLTLDRTDFHGALGRQIHGMSIRTPADFLVERRKAALM